MLSTALVCLLSATPTVHQRLCEVNAEWNKVTPAGDLLEPARYATERALLKDHLRRVEARLRAVPSTSPERARTLDRLHAYIESEECPLNETAATRVPVMIDSLGRHCPVAALMAWDGQDAFVREVAKTANNIYVRDIKDPRFFAWAQRSGLSVDELAAIQPAYTPVTRWRVAIPAADVEAPTGDELKGLPPEDDRWTHPVPRHADGLPREALRGLDGVLTAGPVTYDGAVYFAGTFPREEGRESYQLRRWTGKTWERVQTFRVPINALTVYGGRLYAGGGGHPFSMTEDRASRRAFISSWDGDAWTRVTTEARGQVQAFMTVRGSLCAAVTRFVWPG